MYILWYREKGSVVFSTKEVDEVIIMFNDNHVSLSPLTSVLY